MRRLWAGKMSIGSTVILLTGCILSLFLLAWPADRGLDAEQELAKAVMVANQCGSCHTLQARGLELTGKVGPDLSRQAHRRRSQEWLRRHLADPDSIPVEEVAEGFEKKKGLMPGFARLSDRERTAVVRFLRSLE